MKVNVSYEEQSFADYTNFSVLKNKSFTLKDYDDGELDEILASDIVEYIPRNAFDKVILGWIAKLRKGGIFKIDFLELYEVCRLFYLQRITMSDVNFLLHGPSEKGWDHKTVNLTLPQACATLSKLGLKILSKQISNARATIVAEKQ